MDENLRYRIQNTSSKLINLSYDFMPSYMAISLKIIGLKGHVFK